MILTSKPCRGHPTSSPPDPVPGSRALIDPMAAYKCTVQQQADEIAREANNRQQLIDRIAKRSQAAPGGAGPWPYFVYDTVNVAMRQDIGLKVKMVPSLEGQQVGSAAPGSLVWADCYVINNFNPVVGDRDDVGPKWLRIHWPTGNLSTSYALSSPGAPFLEYVYAGYTLPFTHNGEIPKCS